MQGAHARQTGLQGLVSGVQEGVRGVDGIVDLLTWNDGTGHSSNFHVKGKQSKCYRLVVVDRTGNHSQ